MTCFTFVRPRPGFRVGSAAVIAVLYIVSAFAPAAHAQYWGPSYHSSTAAESQARGLGALIRDQGEANLLNAEAANVGEDARSKYIQNTVDAVQAYYDRRRIHDEYYEEKKAERQAASERFLARRGGLPEISENDIDVTTGEVNWPSALQIKDYDKYRTEYEQILADYYSNGTLSGDQYLKSQNISRAWRKQIGDDRKKIGVEQARNGVRFVLALDQIMQGT